MIIDYWDGKFSTAKSPKFFLAAVFRQRRINSGLSGLATLGNLERQNHHNICVQLYSAGGGQAPALGVRSRIKVECREFAVVFFSGGIIDFGCLYLVIETAEIHSFSIDDQLGFPGSASFVA